MGSVESGEAEDSSESSVTLPIFLLDTKVDEMQEGHSSVSIKEASLVHEAKIKVRALPVEVRSDGSDVFLTGNPDASH